MRVAYVCLDQGVPIFGSKGCSVHAQEILRAFLRRGAEVELFAASLGGAVPPDMAALTVQALPSVCHDDPGERELLTIAQNEKLAAVLREAKPFDLVYERYSLWGTAAMEFAQATGAPGVLEVNAPLINEQRQHRVLVHEEAARLIAKCNLQAADCICAVSREVAEWASGHGAPAGRTLVVPNGVCPERFSPNVPPADAHLAQQFTIGFIGSLKPWHGIEQLVEAFVTLHQSFPDSHLVIVGEGPQYKSLARQRKAAPRSARKHIHLTGSVAPSDVPGWLTSMSVAVAPYPDLPDFYFSPLKVYEYMAAGRAVVVSDIGQLQSVVEHGVNGLRYPAGDTDALVGALARLHDDAALTKLLGQRAQQSVLHGHSWEQRLECILDSVFASKSAAC